MSARRATFPEYFLGGILTSGGTAVILLGVLKYYPPGWVFMIEALDSYMVGDLLNFLLKHVERFTQRLKFALLRYSMAVVGVVVAGAWIGSYLTPLIQGPFPSLLVGLTVVYEFTAVTSILLLVDVLVQHREFIPEPKGFLRS